MIDIKIVKKMAEQELFEEEANKAKERIKNKLKELHIAKTVVENIERELEDLYASIEQGN